MSSPFGPAVDRHTVYVNRHRPLQCAYCGNPISGHLYPPGGEQPRPPEPGDYTVCVECRGVLVYERDADAQLALRPPTAEETAANAEEFARHQADAPAARALLDRFGVRRPPEAQP